ncbi:MAG TPA: selenide, water dikinase SelD, partial [Chloroflexota bacterium]|nr:selenide, water dikinase SelD [Chloroflexota bacterium]
IAAANAMSDIFAMGGEVLLALNVAAFPDNLPLEILTRIFEGGAAMVAQAGGVIAGGHTVSDREPKYGLSVTGLIRPDAIMRKGGAQPGDHLVLTKPLGTGVITTALRSDAASDEDVAAAVASMTTLNLAASRAARIVGAHACTDITGFGLVGHAQEMALAGNVGLRLGLGRLPLLPGARHYAETGHTPGGLGRNRDYFGPQVSSSVKLDPQLLDLVYDPETSGGLLLALAPDRVVSFMDALMPQPSWVIGAVTVGHGVTLAAEL